MTRRIFAALVVSAAIVSTAHAVPVNTEPPSKEDCAISQNLYKRYAKRYVRFSSAGGNYRALPVLKQNLKSLRDMRRCAATLKSRAKMLRFTRALLKQWRFHRYIDRITPFGKWAIPEYIVMRESHGNVCAKNPKSTAGGYYQFLDGTWYSYGGRNYGGDDHPAACAPAWLQHLVAARAWAGGAGSSHWALTR